MLKIGIIIFQLIIYINCSKHDVKGVQISSRISNAPPEVQNSNANEELYELIDNFENIHVEIKEFNGNIKSNPIQKSNNEKENLESSTEILENGFTDIGTIYENDSITSIYHSSTMENVTSFDVVNEDITETLNASSTSTEQTTTVKTKPDKVKSSKGHKSQGQPQHCHCNMMRGSCDVNCCCDDDCSESDKTVFNECTKETKHRLESNLKYCHTQHLVYRNSSPWMIDEHYNGLFCILDDNLPPKLPNNPYKIITSANKIETIVNQHFSWSSIKKSISASFDMSKSYHYGDKIWIISNTTIQTLDVPSSGINMHCKRKSSAKYLVNYKSNCITAASNSSTHNILKNLANMYLISSPDALNETWMENTQECPKNICIPFEAYICDSFKCSLINTSKENFEQTCDNTFCINTISSIKYQLYSNGSMGFIKGQIYFGILDMVFNKKYIEQHFEIQHVWVPKNFTTLVKRVSGNPSYMFGKPIISSKIILKTDKNTSETVETFDYFNPDNASMQNALFLPKNINGFCVLSNVSHALILFGENIRTVCKISYSVKNNTENVSNATQLCSNLQNHVLSIFPDNLYSENKTKTYISMNGSPSLNAKDWIELIFEDTPNTITGTFQNNNKTLICNNFVLKIKYEFVYAYVNQPNNDRHIKLLGAILKYDADNEFIFDIINEKIVLDLSVTTRFYDVTVDQKDEYAKGPRFHIYLPNDFFYPFTYNRSQSIKLMHWIYIILLVYCVRILH